MAEFCTCGTELVPGARFCHKCGRPVREEPAVGEPESVPPPPGPAFGGPAPVQIGFNDRLAVRISLLAAAAGLLLSSFPISPWLPLALMLAAGALSAFLYSRRTGQSLSIRAGMRIGWMTGVFAFVLSMVLMTIALALLPASGEALTRALREQSGLPEQMAERALEIVRNPVELLLSLVLGFLSFSVTAALGGALGARVFGRH